MEPSYVVRVRQPLRKKSSRIAGFFAHLRWIQLILGLIIPLFCVVNEYVYLREGYGISGASEIVTKIVAWTGFITFILAGLGILNTKRERHYYSILLVVDLLACMSSLLSAACLTILTITYWWFNTALWITGITIAWTLSLLSLLLLVRTTLIRRQNSRQIKIAASQPSTTSYEPPSQIDIWRHDVTPEYDPLIPNGAPSQASFDPYADEARQSSSSSRSPSPVSTVAHWTTVSGTNTLITQFTEPPPLYSRTER